MCKYNINLTIKYLYSIINIIVATDSTCTYVFLLSLLYYYKLRSNPLIGKNILLKKKKFHKYKSVR